MFEGLIGTVVIVALIVAAVRQNSRISVLEREISALRGLAFPKPAGAEGSKPVAVAESADALAGAQYCTVSPSRGTA